MIAGQAVIVVHIYNDFLRVLASSVPYSMTILSIIITSTLLHWSNRIKIHIDCRYPFNTIVLSPDQGRGISISSTAIMAEGSKPRAAISTPFNVNTFYM
jgi:hypothetical protein